MKLNTVSKLSLLIISAVAITMTSCKKLDNLVQVNVGLQMAQVPFSISETTAGTTSETDTVHFNVDSAIKVNNASLGVANITSAKVDSVVFNLTSGSFTAATVTTATASFYSDAVSVPVSVAATSAATSATSLTLLPSSTLDLTNYLKATSFIYNFTVVHGNVSPGLEGTATVYFHLVVSPN
jgi:hypothetical protein